MPKPRVSEEIKSSAFDNTGPTLETKNSILGKNSPTVGNQSSSVFGNGYTFGAVSASDGQSVPGKVPATDEVPASDQ